MIQKLVTILSMDRNKETIYMDMEFEWGDVKKDIKNLKWANFRKDS